MTSLSLRDKVQAADPGQLLPSRLRSEGAELPSQLELVQATSLGDQRWLLVLEPPDASDVRYVAPVVEQDDGLCRAAAGDGAAQALISVMASSAAPSDFLSWQAFDALEPLTGERALGVDQTHESVVVGEKAVVKWMLTADVTPAPVVVAHLMANGFDDLPRPWGFVSWSDQGVSRLLAAVNEYLPDASDGWSWCVADVGEVGRGERDLAGALAITRSLAELVARFHIAMSRRSVVVSRPVKPATTATVDAWVQRARSLLDEAVAITSGAEGERLRARVEPIRSAVDVIGSSGGTTTMPIHGDLHVGQILRSGTRYALNDFDGNPVLPAEERGAPQSPARDVAGMVQSLDHVGRVVIKRVDGVDPAKVEEWISQAQVAFVREYRTLLAQAGCDDLLDERLLMPFRVEQELRELVYAQRHLPRWRYVPDAALGALFP